MNRIHRRFWILLLLGAFVLPGCGAIPHKKGDAKITKVAAERGEIDLIFDRYRAVRNSAIELLDPKPLSTVEGETVLAIDSGSFEVSQRLAKKQKFDSSDLLVLEVLSPELKKYPLWFIVRVEDKTRDVIKVQVFERARAADQWLLMASPEILPSTKLPDLERGRDGTVLTVKGTDKTGLNLSPEQAVTNYVAALNDPKSAEAKTVLEDSFMRQMLDGAAASGALKGVTFIQKWGGKDIEYALRTSDGGALVFATLLRQDSYSVKDGLSLTWPDGSPQRAFLGKEISTSGKLNYYHQVLMYVPGKDGGKPRVLGQLGGVVSAEGV